MIPEWGETFFFYCYVDVDIGVDTVQTNSNLINRAKCGQLVDKKQFSWKQITRGKKKIKKYNLDICTCWKSHIKKNASLELFFFMTEK